MAPVEGSPRALDAKGRSFFDGGKNCHRPFEALEMGRYPVLTTRVAMRSIEELVYLANSKSQTQYFFNKLHICFSIAWWL